MSGQKFDYDEIDSEGKTALAISSIITFTNGTAATRTIDVAVFIGG